MVQHPVLVIEEHDERSAAVAAAAQRTGSGWPGVPRVLRSRGRLPGKRVWDHSGTEYPMFFIVHRDVRNRPRLNAFFEFCLREPSAGINARVENLSPRCIRSAW
jgi:hypothetical protein